MRQKNHFLNYTSSFLIIISSVSQARDSKAPSSTNQPRTQLGFVSMLQSAASYIPGDVGCAAREYGDIIRPDRYSSDSSVAGSNAGFITLMEENYKGSKCFRVALNKFYQEVRKADEATPQRSQFLNQNGAPRFRSSVDDLKNNQYKAGSLFEMAMKVSDQDPRLAMQLIAFCGHDDTAQTREEKSQEIHITCPQNNSFMYFNGSLASNGKMQQPSAGQSALEQSRGITDQTPSKNYHVLMGSYIGCRLAEKCNMDEVTASQFERKASLAYRIYRMKTNANGMQAKYKSVIDKYQAEMQAGRLNQTQYQYLSNAIFEFLKERQNKAQTGKKNKGEDFELGFTGKTPKSDTQLRTQAESETKRLLTLMLFDESSLQNGLKLLGQIDLKEDKRLPPALGGNEFKKGQEAYDFLGFKSESTIKKCREISPDKCDSILSELKSWNADLIWTANQHSMGAKFGAEKCKNSRQQRAGGRPAVCAEYDRQPDLTRADRHIVEGGLKSFGSDSTETKPSMKSPAQK